MSTACGRGRIAFSIASIEPKAGSSLKPSATGRIFTDDDPPVAQGAAFPATGAKPAQPHFPFSPAAAATSADQVEYTAVHGGSEIEAVGRN